MTIVAILVILSLSVPALAANKAAVKEDRMAFESGDTARENISPIIKYPSYSAWNLLEFYPNRINYESVTRAVMAWYGTRHNGCVAFMSEAMRQSGYPVPKNVWIDGENVSLQVWGFARWLDQKGWRRVDDPMLLIPGDVVFTHGKPSAPKRPAHVWFFVGWKNQVNGTGWAIDNQGFTHRRNVFGKAEATNTPMRFAYRAP